MGKPNSLSQSQQPLSQNPSNRTSSKKRKRNSKSDRSRLDSNDNKHRTPQTTCDSVAISHENVYADDQSSNGSPHSTGGLPRKSPRSVNQNHPSSRLSEIETEDRTAASSIEEDLGSHTTNSQHDDDHQSRRFSSSDDSHLDLHSCSDEMEESLQSAMSAHSHRHDDSIDNSLSTVSKSLSSLKSTVESYLVILVIYFKSMLEENYPTFAQKMSDVVEEYGGYARCYWNQGKQYLNDAHQYWSCHSVWTISEELVAKASSIASTTQQRLRDRATSLIDYLKSYQKMDLKEVKSGLESTITAVRSKMLQWMAFVEESVDMESVAQSIKQFVSQWSESTKEVISRCRSIDDMKSLLLGFTHSYWVWCSDCLTTTSIRIPQLLGRLRNIIETKYSETLERMNEFVVFIREFISTHVSETIIRLRVMSIRVTAEVEEHWVKIEGRYPWVKTGIEEMKRRMIEIRSMVLKTIRSTIPYPQQSIDYVHVQFEAVKAQVSQSRDIVVLRLNGVKSEALVRAEAFHLTFVSMRQTVYEGAEQLLGFVSSFAFLVDYVPDFLTWFITTVIPEPITKAVVPFDSRLALLLKRDHQTCTSATASSTGQTPEVEPETVLALACDTWVSCHAKPAHVPVRDFQATLKARLQSILGLKVQQTSTTATETASGSGASITDASGHN